MLQETQDLENIKSILTSYTESSMDIIRVERKHHGLYKVFYVSDNSFADGNRFPGFLDRVRLNHPSWRLMLRHIKDIDGRFVTRDEFYARTRR